MTVTEKIDAIIKEKGLSRRQVAIKAQIPTSTFQSAMQRNGSMDIEMIERIADALDVYLFELLDDETKKIYTEGEVSVISNYHSKGYRFTSKERLLVALFNRMDTEGQESALEYTTYLFDKHQLKEEAPNAPQDNP